MGACKRGHLLMQNLKVLYKCSTIEKGKLQRICRRVTLYGQNTVFQLSDCMHFFCRKRVYKKVRFKKPKSQENRKGQFPNVNYFLLPEVDITPFLHSKLQDNKFGFARSV